MHKVYVDLVVDAILEQYFCEETFVKEQLEISVEEWLDWKNGLYNLEKKVFQKVRNLFTDYEWMIFQKIVKQTLLFPEKRPTAVAEYKHLKTVIAKKWLQSTLGIAELSPQYHENQQKQRFVRLKVAMSYDQWGFDDILFFYLPAQLQKQVQGSKVALLDWIQENLQETYAGKK